MTFLNDLIVLTLLLNEINVTSDSGAMTESIARNLAVAAGQTVGGQEFGY